ncbi:type I glyceraldehyde-3-phosphate dehydrogenase [Alphaproteobacteria bacterium]|nr:type I glyceraldehyde-3-phosphate dehydrogenase [Alphaproteobacteria bacterium]
MTVRVGVNGFGRIGRLAIRAIFENNRNDIELVAVNDWKDLNTAAHLIKYDSAHGRMGGQVEIKEDGIDFGRGTVKALSNRNPAELPWGDLGVDIVLECTGKFNTKDGAIQHLDGGAKRVLCSAPCKGADSTIVYGVNNAALLADHTVVSAASCTTNCLAPVADVLHQAVGIESGFCTTIHAYTGDQNTVDTRHKDLRRARAAAVSLIPTKTGAAAAVGQVLPELDGKLDGSAVRVPTVNVSLVDLAFTSSRATSAEELNAALKAASLGSHKGVLAYCDEPLVSIDHNHSLESSVVDSLETKVLNDNFCRVLSWYDNEWAFANRMLDLAVLMGKQG